MKLRPDIRDLLWMAAGAAILLVIVLIMLRFQTKPAANEEVASQARRAELVDQMRLDLALSGEAEKSAVLATTDEESQSFADQARAAIASVEQELVELEDLLSTGGTQRELDLLDEFSKAFVRLQNVEKDLLDLAVQNTNIKAYSLAFGPAADELKGMNTALSKLVAQNVGSPQAADVAALAFGAQNAALRIQTLLAPHIAAESDLAMDEMEKSMSKDDEEVRKDLDGLAALRGLSGGPDLRTATAGYAQFNEIRSRIMKLSRENTNVRSLALSLDQARKEMLFCQDVLAALEQAILEEPVGGGRLELAPNPRDLGVEPETGR